MAQGWICDECSRGVAKDNGTTNPPEGWVQVQQANQPKRDLCSWTCVRQHAEGYLLVREAESEG